MKTFQIKRKAVYLLLPLIGFICMSGQASAQKSENGVDRYMVNDSVYFSVQHMPEPSFNMQKYLRKNLRYPQSAKKDRISGRIITEFIVDKQGKIRDLKIKKGLSPDCDAEAIRVMNAMPAWKPGIQDGDTVYVRYVFPILFER